MVKREEVEKEGEDEVEDEVDEDPTVTVTARGGRRGQGDAVLEEVEIQSFFENATYTRKCRVSRIPQL